MTNRFFAHSLVLRQKSYLFISVPPKAGKSRGRITPFTTLLNATSSMLGNVFKEIPKTLYLAEEISNKFISNIDGFNGVSFKRLGEDELKRLYSQYYNLDFKDEHQEGMLSEMLSDFTGMQLGHRQLRIVSLYGRGQEIEHSVNNADNVSDSYTHRLGLKLNIPHVTTTVLRLENTEKQLDYLDRQKFWNRSFSLGILSSQSNKVAEENIDEFTSEIRNSDSAIVSLAINVMVYEFQQEVLRYYIDQTESSFSTISGSKSAVESCDTTALFFANVPGNGFNNYRMLMMDTERATAYLQYTGATRSHQRGDLLCDRSRNPVRVNFSDRSHLTNQNAMVVGPTGSGKSFTVGEFILQRKERRCRQVIIDVGGTYRNTMTLLNGAEFEQTYFEYKGDQAMSFAPFMVPRNQQGAYLLDGDRRDFLLSLLSTIWKGADLVQTIKQVEKTVLLDLIDSYYYHVNQHLEPASFSGFYEFCKACHQQSEEQEDIKESLQYFDIREFLLVLKPFHQGAYKNLLNGKEAKDISEYDLVCFDMHGIQSNKMLYPIVSQLIIQLVLDQLAKFPDDEKFLYIDEAWSMLEGTLGNFMQAMFRTIRKVKGSIWIITQNINDITRSTHHKAIFANTDIKIILRHTDAGLREETAQMLGLTPHGGDLLASLRKGDTFRDMLIKTMDEVRVYTMEVAPEHAAVLSSNPEERNAFLLLLSKHKGNHKMALEEFIAHRRSAA